MTLVFDENFPHYLPEALRLFKYDAAHVLDNNDRGTADDVLFARLAQSGSIWVSHDKGVKRKPHERQAFLVAGLGAFILTGRAKRDAREMMIFVLQHIEEMLEYERRHQRPFVVGITDRGKFEVLS